MNFLAPLFLAGGLAVALPVLFHLARRHSRERTRFGSLMFLKPAPPRVTRRSRLEHLLLLVLRCVVLVLLALAFARPWLRDAVATPAPSALGRKTAVLVDTSASMRRVGAWDDARRRAEAVAREAGPGDRVALLAFDRQTRLLSTFAEWDAAPADGRAALVAVRLAQVSPGWAGTRLDQALIRAADMLSESEGREAPGPRRIVLIADMQEGSRLDALQAYEWPKGVEVVVAPVTVRAGTNAGLQWLPEAAGADRTGDPAVRVRVSNASDAKSERFRVGWARADGNFLGAAVEMYVPPGQSRVVALPLPAAGAPSDRIVLRGDDEDFDNAVFVIAPATAKVDVLYLGSDAAGDSRRPQYFLRRALPDNRRLAVRLVARTSDAAVSAADLAAPVAFVTDALPDALAGALRARMLAGATVVFAPRAASAAGTLTQLLGGAPAALLEEARPESYAMFGEIDFGHPLFVPFADPRFGDFTKIHVWRYRKLGLAGVTGARIVARFDNGDSAVVDVPAGRGRLIVLAAGWAPEDSQLALSSKFVPLIDSILELGGAVPALPSQLAVGDPSLPATAVAPGLHRLDAGPAAPLVAVNLDPSESRTAPLARDELERFGVPLRAASNGDVNAVTPPPTPKPGAETEGRQKLWRWLVLAALGVLLVETGLAGWTARRAALAKGAAS